MLTDPEQLLSDLLVNIAQELDIEPLQAGPATG